MCERDPRYQPDAADDLAFELLAAVKTVPGTLNAISVDAAKLREIIQKRWERIAALAHAIHDEKPAEVAPGKLVSTERVTHRDIAGNETVTTTEYFTAE